MKLINEIKFSPNSLVDDFGRVFFYGNKVYRAINNDKIEFCNELLNSMLFRELSEKKLIPKTTISDFQIENHAIVLEHEKLIEIQVHEWSFTMLKDAAILILNINRICNKHGYELKDAHPLNILFRGCSTPVLVDIGSISKKNNSKWYAFPEFLNAFLVPLLFWSEKKHYIVRKLLESNFHRMFTIPSETLEESDLLNILKSSKRPYVVKFRNSTIIKTKRESPAIIFLVYLLKRIVNFVTGKKLSSLSYSMQYAGTRFLPTMFPESSVENVIENLKPPYTNSIWQGYHTKYYNDLDNVSYSNRFIRLLNIIKELHDVKSVIDLAGNEGYFTFLLAKEIKHQQYILTDYDENAIDNAYNTFKNHKSENVHTALLNFIFSKNIENSIKRFKSDLVLALAVTHHLILTEQYSIATIFERLKMFSNKYIIVEFMPLGLWAIGDAEEKNVPNWYTVDWFRENFTIYCNLLIEEQLETNRIVFLGEVKG